MRASRLLSILTTLQAKGHITAQALADECEVSLRTIYRDVDALSAAGIPIYSERGSSGGYRLLEGYRVRLNGFSSAEADALFLAGLAREASELGLGAVAASARNKLLAALPEAMRPNAMRARFHLDAPAWFDEGETLAQLPRLAHAVWGERAIRMRYQSTKSNALRRVEPLGLILKGGVWYLVAQGSEGIRTYRASRIEALEVLDEQFAWPQDFDLQDYWAQSTRRYEADLHPNKALIRLSPKGIKLMDAFLPPFVRSGAVFAPEADEEGWYAVTISVGSYAHAAMEILRFGVEAEVIGPPELRAKIGDITRRLSAIYSEPPAQS